VLCGAPQATPTTLVDQMIHAQALTDAPHHQEDTVPDDNAMPHDLFHQHRLAILDRPDDDGLRTSTTSRSDLDSGEAFLRDRQQLLDHLTITHHDSPPYREADRASLNRWHWERHGSDLATFLHAHPVQV
jgi:hypothetical protein